MGEKNVHFEYRNLGGVRPISKKEAEELAKTIWLVYDGAKQKKRKSAGSKKTVAA